MFASQFVGRVENNESQPLRWTHTRIAVMAGANSSLVGDYSVKTGARYQKKSEVWRGVNFR
jgi:hypothetical protein